ncbi:UNVERIFIED_CONTAM: hypothetical protein FKN15_011706 [Acipenser sinensis]
MEHQALQLPLPGIDVFQEALDPSGDVSYSTVKPGGEIPGNLGKDTDRLSGTRSTVPLIISTWRKNCKSYGYLGPEVEDKTKQVAHCKVAQALDPLDVRALDPLDLRALDPLDVRALDPLDVRALDPLDLRALDPLDVWALDPPDI